MITFDIYGIVCVCVCVCVCVQNITVVMSGQLEQTVSISFLETSLQRLDLPRP